MPDEVPTKEQWVANGDVIKCMCCRDVSFSMFNRRHHCRRCGRVVCFACSTKRMLVPSYGDIMVRVCSDCFAQTFRDSSLSEDTTSTKSMPGDYWMLTSDPEHNRIVREEFSYEFAPSVSLCLSLMKFHSKSDEYSWFLLGQCEVLLKLLIPTQDLLQEIDYMLVIRMLKSLALAAKMASEDASLNCGASVDMILTQAERLALLAERGCLNMLYSCGGVDAISLKRLTDKLLEKEQWKLALEVSTKVGIDKSGVFAAWGMSCLKAGSLATAREKFSKCLNKNPQPDPGYYDIDSSSLRVIKNPPLLNDIIRILESKREPLDKESVAEHQKFLDSTMTLNQSVTSCCSSTEGALFISNRLKRLKMIETGYLTSGRRQGGASKRPHLEDVIYDECVYYLNKYGTVVSLVEFHVKYGRFGKAVDCIIKKKLPSKTFVGVYLKCLEKGSVKVFQAHMSEMDPTLGIWKDHLEQVCCYLAKNKFLHSLYQLQLYMGDYVRAVMTCVLFYKDKAASYGDLIKNSHFLDKSQEHLAQAKEQEQWVAVSTVKTVERGDTFEETSVVSPLIKKMSNQEISRHTATIQMQNEIAHYLADQEAKGALPMQIYADLLRADPNRSHKTAVPTLFDSVEQRTYLAALCIVCGDTIGQGFPFALRIIRDYKLESVKVYKEACKYLAQSDKFPEIEELRQCIQSGEGPKQTLTDICDEMLVDVIDALKNSGAPEAQIDKLIKLISDKTKKISLYIEAKQLKTAYFLATKYKRIEDIRRIMRKAELLNQTAIKDLCLKALQKYSRSDDMTV